MPTYEYRCLDCGRHFEAFQMISEPPIEQCPHCGGRAQRLISAGAGLLFKGNGFYITDYRSREYKKAAEGESKSKGGSSSGSESGSSSSSSESHD
jgi:putative FmdB family regulatory protein